MKKNLFYILMLFSLTTVAQTKFESGYYIKNNGEKINGLIKNIDWKNNPSSIDFKANEESVSQTITIQNAKEFAINDKVKFIRETVSIDQSSQNDYTLSTSSEPIFKEETVFLRVMVEGVSNLYFYESENTTKFFYSNNDKVEQLVFKRYYKDSDIALNEGYKRQLYINFKCSTEDKNKIEKLKYKEDDLVEYFTQTNNCKSGTTGKTVVAKREKIETHLRANILGSMTGGAYNLSNGNIRGNYTLDSKIALSFGFEVEFVFPFNNREWSIIFDPSFVSKKDEINIHKPMLTNPDYTIKSDVFMIRLPIGIRKYFPINEDNKIFANASANFNLSTSKIDFDQDRPSADESYSSTNFSIGIGYQFRRYTVELRSFLKTDVINHTESEDFYITQTSLKLGYRFF